MRIKKGNKKMRQINGTVIGVKKPKEYGKKYAIHMTYEDIRVNGLAVCTAYTDESHEIGEVLTVIESNFRYMILK